MSYSAKSPEIELRRHILKLFDRLAKIHKKFENKAMEIDSMGEDKNKIGSTILSMFDKSSENNKNQIHPTAIENNIKLRKDVIEEFVYLYDTPIAYKKMVNVTALL